MTYHEKLKEIFSTLGSSAEMETLQGLRVTSPWTGENIAHLAKDTEETLGIKIGKAKAAQARFADLKRSERNKIVEAYANAIKEQQKVLGEIVRMEAGKTQKEANGEAGASGDVMLKAITDTSLADVGGMARTKERPPVGVVGLITSFNFPLAVAHWTMSAAFVAGNSVVWKPSEKTPLSALACKAIFDKAVPAFADLLQVVIGEREMGEGLVESENIDLVSATGSVGMGQGIAATLKHKKNNAIAPILELGGNNGIIISEHTTPEHIEFAVGAIMQSFLGTTGQRCTNSRRIIVHQSKQEMLIDSFTKAIEAFMDASCEDGRFDEENSFGYAALIDEDAFNRFEAAKQKVAEEGGRIIKGGRLDAESLPKAYYVEPALAIMPEQTPIMHTETFAPLLYIAPYTGDFQNALDMVNAPENAGLVGAIYTLKQSEAEAFAQGCDAGHVLINSPKGTGTPAYGMGFGGNKESGCGEILNGADLLAAFTRPGKFTRIAENTEIKMQD